MQPTSKKYDAFNVYQDVDRSKYRQDYVLNYPGPKMADVVYHQDPSMRPSKGWSQNGVIPLELENMFRHYDKRGMHPTDKMKTMQQIQDELGGADAVSLIPLSKQNRTVDKFQLYSHIEQPAFLLRGLENTRELDFPLRDPLAHVFNEVPRDMNTVEAVKDQYRTQNPNVRSRGEARHIPTFVIRKDVNPANRARF